MFGTVRDIDRGGAFAHLLGTWHCLADAERGIGHLAEFASRSDWMQVRELAHAVKGVAGNVGLVKLAADAGDVQALCRHLDVQRGGGLAVGGGPQEAHVAGTLAGAAWLLETEGGARFVLGRVARLSGDRRVSEATRVAIVTGGTGALGQSIVLRFLRDGATVAVPWFVLVQRHYPEFARYFSYLNLFAAFMLVHPGFADWSYGKDPKQSPTRDDVLDNITLYWLTNTAISSGRLYWENTYSYFGVKGVSIPVAVSVFPDELYPAPRSWAEKAYPKLIHYNKVEKGGHFAAWEQPELFTQELRAAFKSLR